MVAPTVDDNEPVSWPLHFFAVGKDFTYTKVDGDRTEVFTDRATHEFGIIYYESNSVAHLARFPDTNEPVYFQAQNALAAHWHNRSNKVSLLFEYLQIDLGFLTPKQARVFLNTLETATTTVQNNIFCCYEHTGNSSIKLKEFNSSDFDMVKDGYVSGTIHPWVDVPSTLSEWPNLRKTGEWSDFTIIAGDKSFAVHRVRLCKESCYFKAVCNGGFTESNARCIKLPESERTIGALLDEMYDTYNSTTGSLFTGFALRSEMEKERVLNELLDLFIASDKYNLEKIKTKAAKAIIDRMPFTYDTLTVVDVATCIFDEHCPQVDRGLRKAIIAQVQDRLPTIINDDTAWEELSESKAVLKALHLHMLHCDTPTQLNTIATLQNPPPTPAGGKRKRTL